MNARKGKAGRKDKTGRLSCWAFSLLLAVTFSLVGEMAVSQKTVKKTAQKTAQKKVEADNKLKAPKVVSLKVSGVYAPDVLYAHMSSEYRRINNGALRLKYLPGSRERVVADFISGQVELAVVDVPLSKKQMAMVQGGFLHLPVAITGAAVTYNIPGVTQSLRLSRNVLVGIFLGKIRFWDDLQIRELNPDVTLPKRANIIPVYNSEVDATSILLTRYLSRLSPEWKARQVKFKGKGVDWEYGVAAKGANGLVGAIQQNRGAIGVVDYSLAVSNNLPVARLENRSERYVAPSTKSLVATAKVVAVKPPKDFRFQTIDREGAVVYPMATFSYILASKEMEPDKAEATRDFLKWSAGPGQQLVSALKFSPLPSRLAKQVRFRAESLVPASK